MSQTQHETQIDNMPPMVVDRAPELARNPLTFSSTYDSCRVYATDYIDNSVRGDGNKCVLAKIIQDKYPGCEPHIEGENPYLIMVDGTKIPLAIDPVIIKEISKFDRGEPAFKDMRIYINIR